MEDAPGLIKPKALQSWAYEHIKDIILNRQVQPGRQLRIEDLAKKLNISRTPIREALLKLESEGLVRISSRVGFFVADFTVSDLRELFELRELIEGYAAEQAAPKLTSKDLERIEQLQESAAAAFQKNDLAGFNQCEIALHDYVLGHSGNQRLLKLIEGLKDLIYRERQYALKSRDNVRRFIQEHRVLINALRERDVEKAGLLMRAHLRNVRDRLLGILDQSNGASSESSEHGRS